MPRTPDGHPDFQGVWANNGMTPLERPKQFGMRTTMTDAELADLKKKAQAMQDGGDAFFADELVHRRGRGQDEVQLRRHPDRQLRPDVAVRPHVGQPHLAHHRSARRPDSARWRLARPSAPAREARRAKARGPADSAADLSLGTRCVSYGTPNIRAGYQSYFEITQGPGVVALRSEMIHDARIFSVGDGVARLAARSGSTTATRARDGRATPSSSTPPTTSPTPRAWARPTSCTRSRSSGARRHDTLEYYVTFDDPTVWSRPWTLMIPLKMTGERMFEYACHEGNYGLPAILRGAREQEKLDAIARQRAAAVQFCTTAIEGLTSSAVTFIQKC